MKVLVCMYFPVLASEVKCDTFIRLKIHFSLSTFSTFSTWKMRTPCNLETKTPENSLRSNFWRGSFIFGFLILISIIELGNTLW